MENSVILNAAALNDGNISGTAKELSANPYKFYLISTDYNDKLCNVIDRLSKSTRDNSFLTRIRFAYDVNFELPTELRIGNAESGTPVRSLADLLERLEYDKGLMLARDDYHVVVDDTDVAKERADKAVARLFQQTVFLNLNIDIKKRSEIRKALIKERFRSNYERLRAEIEDKKQHLSAALASADLTDSGKERVKGMIAAFDKMIDELGKARKRPLRIAAMGTKKAGKSVVINGMLKCDYAPTSSELPTPNVIKYIPGDADQPLTLEYKGQKTVYADTQTLHNFIDEEFHRAQSKTGEGSGLPDMNIYYPCDELNGYEIWDTPGPNFAGAGEEHQKIAEECIDAADVCIFVMNYSNHLTNDEVKFLEQIRATFEEKNKFYSLFITVNRIDERYAAEVQKSVNRILDYISGRLEDLNYRNIVIFGTSALQSFYLDKVLALLEADGIEVDEDNILYDAIRKAKRKHKDVGTMTQLRFIEDSLKNLEDFHEIEDADAKILENMSGVPQLWRHVRYIGEQKVDTEIVDSVVSKCEMQFATIRNALLVTGLQELTEQDRLRLVDLEQKIVELSNVVGKAMADVSYLAGDDRELRIAKADVTEESDSIKKSALRSTRERCAAIIDGSTITEDDVSKVENGERTSNINDLLTKLDNLIVSTNKNSEEKLVQLIAVEGGNFSRKVETAVQGAQQKIVDATERVKASVESNTVAGDMMRAFTLPQFPVSLNKLSSSFTGLSSAVSSGDLSNIAGGSKRTDTEFYTVTERRKRGAKGFWEHVKFWKTYYEDVDVTRSREVVRADVKSFKTNVKRMLNERIASSIEDAHDDMKRDVQGKIESVYADVKAQCDEIGAGYRDIFDKFKADVDAAMDATGAHKRAIENDIRVLVEIEQYIQPFFALWQSILYGEGAR